MNKILIVEDDSSIRNLVKMTLSMDKYDTLEADNGNTAFDLIQTDSTISLILLDIMLPKMDGYELLSKIKDKNIPVIFITAKSSLQDKVFGLKLGADDYIVKPFEPIELLARVESVLRRYMKGAEIYQKENHTIFYHDIEINEQERVIKKNSNIIIMTAKEFDLFLLLAKNINIVFTREQLLDKVWGYDYYGNSRTVDMHIKQLRQKLELRDEIETVYKIGYKLKE